MSNTAVIEEKKSLLVKRRYTIGFSKKESCTRYTQFQRSKKNTFDYFYEEMILAMHIPDAIQRQEKEVEAINCMVYIACKDSDVNDLDGFDDTLLQKNIQPEGRLKMLAYAIAGRINNKFLKNSHAKLIKVLDQLDKQSIEPDDVKDAKEFRRDCLSHSMVSERRYKKIICENDPKYLSLISLVEENVKNLIDPCFTEYDILKLKYGLFGNNVHTLAEISEKLSIPMTKMGAYLYNTKIMFLELEGNTCPADIFIQITKFEKTNGKIRRNYD